MATAMTAWLCVAAMAGPLREEEPTWIDNPVYVNWKAFKPGAGAVYKTTTEVSGVKRVMKTSYVLTKMTPERAVVEITVTLVGDDGKETANPAQKLDNPARFRLRPGIDPTKFGKPQGVTEEGEETVKAAGKSIKAKWFKAKSRVEAGDMLTTSWSSAEVPGGMVKSETKVPATKLETTIELVEILSPPKEEPKADP